uniref:Uncharacterized protein n=1 Tax=Strombidium inclinatum TaxID=197538 RepID=A0A7S3MXF4_9SPIT|mmetsp:Transcript_17798/g.27524  ORF Transcript_17798/g.27524 Transcript_17798/m.27524 type:complete len:301 (+) Transcript_17798:1422-2324(+)
MIGNNELPKVGIYTFVIKSKLGKYLHPLFVCSLLNDLFGLQTRAGCQCSTVSGQKFLGIDLNLSRRYKEALMNEQEVLRIGFCRLNFNYFFSREDCEYILRCIEFVAEYGWMFLPHYSVNLGGKWGNIVENQLPRRRWLKEISYDSGKMTYMDSTQKFSKGIFPVHTDRANVRSLDDYLNEAKDILVQTVKQYKAMYGGEIADQRQQVSQEYQHLIWFLYPSEVLELIYPLNPTDDLTFTDIEKWSREQKPQHEEEWSTLFIPRDYRRNTYECKFSEEYIQKEEELKKKPKPNSQFLGRM